MTLDKLLEFLRTNALSERGRLFDSGLRQFWMSGPELSVAVDKRRELPDIMPVH